MSAEVWRLPAPDRMEVVQDLVHLVAPSLAAEQELGLVEAIDEADEGPFVAASGKGGVEAGDRRREPARARTRDAELLEISQRALLYKVKEYGL